MSFKKYIHIAQRNEINQKVISQITLVLMFRLVTKERKEKISVLACDELFFMISFLPAHPDSMMRTLDP